MCLLRRRAGLIFLSLSITWFNLDSGAFKCSTVSERAFYFLSGHVELSVINSRVPHVSTFSSLLPFF